MPKTHDYIHHYRGLWTPGARCRIEVYEPAAPGRPPAIVCSELDDNANTSVTNAAELIAAEVVARHFPALLDVPAAGCQPVTWIEHYSAQCGLREEYDLVIFVPWRITVARVGGVRRRSLGTPSWRRLTAAEVDELLGLECVAC
ncbi:MAG TPA: hypothetical protein VFL91_22095 [Thermomicrobiales bacterium]|nr:hypothetical protein [Thermomicrobiales bacterium]